jgi:hypothetical protein
LVNSEMRDKDGFYAAILANKWGIVIEAAKRTRLVTTQKGIRRMIHPSLMKQYKLMICTCVIAAILTQLY